MKVKLKAQIETTKLRENDDVIITDGKSKKQTGKIVKILRSKNAAIVGGVNIGYKAIKPNPNKDEAGGIKPIEMPVPLSNIAIFNPSTGKADKIGYKFEDGKKLRVYKSTGEVVVANK